MRIMLDLDGVLRDLVGNWRRMWTAKFGEPQCDPSSWRQFAQAGAAVGMDEEETYRLLFDEWGYELTSSALPYPGAVGCVRNLRKAGHWVVIGTDQRTENMRFGTVSWLAFFRVPFDELVFTSDKATIEADVYVEDRPETLLALKRQMPGRLVVRMRRPWNQCLAGDGRIPAIDRLEELWGLMEGWGAKGT